VIVLRGIRFGETALSRTGEASTGNHHAVVTIAVTHDNFARLGASWNDGHRLGWIIELRIEYDHVAPERPIRNDHCIPHAIINGQLLIYLPGILGVRLIAAAAENCVRPLAQL